MFLFSEYFWDNLNQISSPGSFHLSSKIYKMYILHHTYAKYTPNVQEYFYSIKTHVKQASHVPLTSVTV